MASGRPLSFSTQHSLLVPVKMLFRWLARQNVILSNPASDIELPKLPLRLPRHVLTPDEAEAVLAQPDVKTPNRPARPRHLGDVLLDRHAPQWNSSACTSTTWTPSAARSMIRDGKGRRDRVVPDRGACGRVDQEVHGRGPAQPRRRSERHGALRHQPGDPFPENTLTYLAQGYIEASGIGKKGACHIFRHSMATAMLENGADVRFIQAMLGHARLSSTEVYTHVAIRKLIDIHSKTHPGATLARKPRPAVTEPEQDREALLASLEEDADDEA